MGEPVIPCPTCPEGWRPLDKEHCAECYEGKIERLVKALERARDALMEAVTPTGCIGFDSDLREIDCVLDDVGGVNK